MKELLRKAFEAGKDKQWDIEWQMGRSKPDFEEWHKEHESQALNIPVVVFSEAELKAKLAEQLEKTRQWLIDEDFEGLAERL